MNTSAKMCLAGTVQGFDGVEPSDDCAVVKNDSAVHYAMVPVWILTTRYNNEPYTFMMNGQTGKVVGSLPIDYGKLRNYSAMAFAICAVIAFAILYFVL